MSCNVAWSVELEVFLKKSRRYKYLKNNFSARSFLTSITPVQGYSFVKPESCYTFVPAKRSRPGGPGVKQPRACGEIGRRAVFRRQFRKV